MGRPASSKLETRNYQVSSRTFPLSNFLTFTLLYTFVDDCPPACTHTITLPAPLTIFKPFSVAYHLFPER